MAKITQFKPLVGVVLGSRSDFNVMRRGLETLRVMGVPYIFEIASPHRTPERVAKFASTAGEMGMEVLIAAAGGNGQLPGILACYTTLPVIGVPIDATPMRGEDALLGISQMPPGTPVATVGINSAENAAILAAQILAIKHPRFREVLAHRRMTAGQKLERFLVELANEYPDLCDTQFTAPRPRPSVSDVETEGGTEDNTPVPPEETTERIRPGAVLIERTSVKAGQAGHLVSTPLPQEPGTVTEDSSLADDTPSPTEATTAETPRNAPPLLPLPTRPASNGVISNREAALSSDVTPTIERPSEKPSVPVTVMERVLSREEPHDTDQNTQEDLDSTVFTLDPSDPDVNVLEHAMLVLLEGGLIAMPTDTVYGLAADATNPEAVRRLLELKGHDPAKKSLAMLIGDTTALDNLVTEVPGPLERVLDEFWPGALTVLFTRRPTVLPNVSDAPSIGVRVPADPVALQLLMMMSRPLAVINTAKGTYAPATTAAEVLERFSGRVNCILDAGPCSAGEASTVLSALIEPFEILREGAVKRDELKRLLGDKLK
jgi:5-(carboxyamino)imidazole ribonucleotide mutase